LKVRFICEFCDGIFDEAEFSAGELADNADNMEVLTEDSGRGIILEGPDGTGGYFLSVCPDCNNDLHMDENAFVFLQNPLIH